MKRSNESASQAVQRISARPDGYRILETPEGDALLRQAHREAQAARAAARKAGQA
jgi:hypothetical protein